jgi:hypothetical protein
MPDIVNGLIDNGVELVLWDVFDSVRQLVEVRQIVTKRAFAIFAPGSLFDNDRGLYRETFVIPQRAAKQAFDGVTLFHREFSYAAIHL